ncbi:MAG: ATP-dependent RecD-like DNA helicase [Desulfobacteraceae bacterium]|nr:ATP-dependent RecD-like DNA helicase [Desulfobacteraceae bacterium]
MKDRFFELRQGSGTSLPIRGRVAHITYQNAENHFTVARLKTEDGARITIAGHLPGLRAGETIGLRGRWTRHPRYGDQLDVDAFEVLLPADAEGIRAYLNAGALDGLGPKTADRLVACFGSRTLEILDDAPERLQEVPGIGVKRAAAIAEAWAAHSQLRRLMRFLQECGVNPLHTGALHRLYGAEAEVLLREDPYQLAADLPGEGFPVADAIARRLGIDTGAPRRQTAALGHLVARANAEGHVWCSRLRLFLEAERRFGIGLEAAENALAQLKADGQIIEEPIVDEPEDSAIYPAALHSAEVSIARRLAALRAIPTPPLLEDPERIAGGVLAASAIAPCPEQMAVLQGILGEKAAIVTGGPGTGKTTLICAYAGLMRAAGRRTTLAAPTGRAARHLGEVAGLPAATIHRLLGYTPAEDRFLLTADHPLDTDALIVDEASMIDTPLMAGLMAALPLSARLLLVGDARQLPSVGPGNVLADLIGAGGLPVYALTTIFRQANAGPIVVNAHRIRHGEMPVTATTDAKETEFRFIEVSGPAAAVAAVVRLCQDLPREMGLDPMRDIQVLTPMHRGEAGTVNLNQVLQEALNPLPPGKGHRNGRFRPGDKVMHLKNNYSKAVFNGDIGTVAGPEPETGGLQVDFDGRRVAYAPAELDQLALAYAITVHKSQGGEYPAVILPLLTQHYPMLQRNLLYTAVTRGRRQVVLVGSRKALAIAVANDRPTQRLTGLRQRLAAALRGDG